MINYNKNKLINEALENYYNTFSCMLNTAEFVPEKFNAKISKYIFKNMKKMFKRIDKEDSKFQRELVKRERKKNKTKHTNIFKRIANIIFRKRANGTKK